MAKSKVHVVPHDAGWAVKREGNTRASSLHPTKADAVDSGRSAAKTDKVELVIHNRNGRISDSDSFGKDPCPPQDTKH